jgi:hypothetical protein
LRDAVTSHLDTENAFEALMSAAIFKGSHGFTPSEAALEVIDVLGIESPPETLATVLASPNLSLVSKAVDLETTYEHVLHMARVLTDVRPLFDDSEDTELVGSIIVHTLQMTSFGTMGTQDLFVAMDDRDLVALRKQIDRAISKSKRLRQTLDDGKLAVVPRERGRHE